jgi:dihydroorotate dehydrogenase electron transfer subunit
MGTDGLHCRMRVMRTESAGENGVILTLDGNLPAQPGQFAMIWLPGVEERPLSIANDAPLTLAVAAVGPFTRALWALTAGAPLWVRGPYGRGFPEMSGRHLLVGGGSGAAGLSLLARRLRARGQDVAVVLGARNKGSLMLEGEFHSLGCVVRLATDDGSMGLRGTALEAVGDLLESDWPDAIYACGPEPMLRALADSPVGQRKPLWVSLERTMKCGLGVCGNCHCGDHLVCADGPVFDHATYQQMRALEADRVGGAG